MKAALTRRSAGSPSLLIPVTVARVVSPPSEYPRTPMFSESIGLEKECLVKRIVIAGMLDRGDEVSMTRQGLQGVGHILGRCNFKTMTSHQQRKPPARHRCPLRYRIEGRTAGKGQRGEI